MLDQERDSVIHSFKKITQGIEEYIESDPKYAEKRRGSLWGGERVPQSLSRGITGSEGE